MERLMLLQVHSDDGTIEMTEKACRELHRALGYALTAEKNDGWMVCLEDDGGTVEVFVEVETAQGNEPYIFHCGEAVALVPSDSGCRGCVNS